MCEDIVTNIASRPEESIYSNLQQIRCQFYDLEESSKFEYIRNVVYVH